MFWVIKLIIKQLSSSIKKFKKTIKLALTFSLGSRSNSHLRQYVCDCTSSFAWYVPLTLYWRYKPHDTDDGRKSNFGRSIIAIIRGPFYRFYVVHLYQWSLGYRSSGLGKQYIRSSNNRVCTTASGISVCIILWSILLSPSANQTIPREINLVVIILNVREHNKPQLYVFLRGYCYLFLKFQNFSYFPRSRSIRTGNNESGGGISF